jgi:regulator of cell morphogenesis and NO signaling
LINKLHIPIGELVAADPKLGFVLHAQGIKFYEHADSTVAAISSKYAFNLKQFIRQADWQYQYQLLKDPLSLNKHSATHVIDYLSFMHRLFIKEKLPYFSTIIQDFHNTIDDKRIADLKWAFPYFQEDFVHHIFEEEDHLFMYLRQLAKGIEEKKVSSKLMMDMEKCSIKDYSLHHLLDDDEMAGIRSLTNHYTHLPTDSLELRVLFFELREFEKELNFHARIENEVLFPKALTMENNVRMLIRNNRNCN